jgi:hypothetical protein
MNIVENQIRAIQQAVKENTQKPVPQKVKGKPLAEFKKRVEAILFKKKVEAAVKDALKPKK